VQRVALALAVITIMLWGAPASAQFVSCQPLPYWYPRGWELMIRHPCYIYGAYGLYGAYGPSYQPTYSYPASYPHRVVHRVHRRPYLRPGWWW
jgi:hypothetical protein